MSTSTVAMIQSSYIPWKGYFDQINMADIFVFYDDVQYTKEDWRTRNRIKTSQGLQWLTIPCGENLKRLICDVRMESVHWQRKHWKSIHQNYRKAQYFDVYAGYFEPLYLEREWIYLSDLNQTFTKMIAREILGIDTVFRDSREFGLSPGKKREDRWLELMQKLGAERLLAGPKARTYLDEPAKRKVRAQGVEMVWMDYSGYPEYRQLYPPFEHHVSIVDLIMNEGPNAADHMLSFGRRA
jgi:hypothetical protein